MSIVHLVPQGDQIEHIETPDCPCRPIWHEPGMRDPEIPVVIIEHRPMDGVLGERFAGWTAKLHKRTADDDPGRPTHL